MKNVKKLFIAIFLLALLFTFYCFNYEVKADTPTPTITITDAAAIRTTDPCGLMFQAEITGEFAEGAKYYFAFVKGTPTASKMEELIEDTIANPGTPKVAICEASNVNGVVRGSVVNFGTDASNYKQKITAMAYVTVSTNNTYSSTIATKNILEIARKAYGDSNITDANVISYVQGIAETGKIAVTRSSGIVYYDTIADLNSNLVEGDIVDFISGTYDDEALTITKNNVKIYGPNKDVRAEANSEDEYKPKSRNYNEAIIKKLITIKNDTGASQVTGIEINGLELSEANIELMNSTNVTISNIILQSTPVWGYGEEIRKACIYTTSSETLTNITISNSYIQTNNENDDTKVKRDAIYLYNVNGLNINNNSIIYKHTEALATTEAIYVRKIAGDIEINSNLIKYPTDNWSIFMGSTENTASLVNISDNDISGYDEAATAGIAIYKAMTGSNTIICNNKLDIGGNTLSFDGSCEDAVIDIKFNNIKNEYKIKSTGDGNISNYSNYCQGANNSGIYDTACVSSSEALLANYKSEMTKTNLSIEEADYNAISKVIPDVIVKSDLVADTNYNLIYNSNDVLEKRVYTLGTNAFTTVKAAYEHLANKTGLSKVYVFKGTYSDDITISKPTVLYGPNYGICGNDANRKTEATFTGQITVGSNNVGIAGVYLNVSTFGKYGITTSGNISNLTLNYINQTYSASGALSSDYGAIYSSNNITVFKVLNSKFYMTNGKFRDAICITGKVTNLTIDNCDFSNGNQAYMNEAIYIDDISGVVNITNNTFVWGCKAQDYVVTIDSTTKTYDRGYIITLGDRNRAASNSCSKINILNNHIEGKSSTNSSPSISICSAPAGSVTMIKNNDFIQNNESTSLHYFNFRNSKAATDSKSAASIEFEYNYFNNNIVFNIKNKGSASYEYVGNCFAGGVNANYNSNNGISSSINNHTNLKACYDDIRNYVLTNTADTTKSASEYEDIQKYIADFDNKYVNSLKIENGVIKYNTASSISEFINAAKAAGLNEYTPA